MIQLDIRGSGAAPDSRPSTRARAMLLCAVVLAAAAALAACGDDGGGDGTLTVYSGREEELVAPLFERYEKESGDDVKVRYGDSAELAATILEEGENSPADVFFSQDAGALGALEKEDRLADLPVELVERVDPSFRSQAGRWVGTSGRARVVAYNTDELSEQDLPASLLDFTDPEWEDRIGWAPTNASFQAQVTAVRAIEGQDVAAEWLQGIVANEPEAFADNETVRDAIAAGEVDVGFINHYYVAQAQEEEGPDYPVAVYFPPGGDVGSLINVAGAGVIAGGDESEGIDFVEFLLAPEAQRFFSEETKEYPLIDGVEADPSVVPLRRIEQPEIDLGDLDDLSGTLRLIEQSGAL
jgi:iron(III) transport system substrate-binding protein